MKILVTGCAGFIGFHLSNFLLKKNFVVGIDNINDYYSKNLKLSRIKILKKNSKKNLILSKLIFQITVNYQGYLKNINLI